MFRESCKKKFKKNNLRAIKRGEGKGPAIKEKIVKENRTDRISLKIDQFEPILMS